MARAHRKRTIPCEQDAVWELVSDPRNLPRWWPQLERVEGIEADSFTEVLRSGRGRTVRADFRVTERERPARLRWEQQLEGSPFERFLRRRTLTIALEPAGEGATAVALELDQGLVGISRLGAPMMNRAARQQLDQVLARLDGLVRDGDL